MTTATKLTRKDLPDLLTRMAAYEVSSKTLAVQKGWKPVGTCIGTSRFASNMLRSLGFQVEVVPVSLFVTNDPYRRAEHEGIFDGGTEADRDRYYRQGAYSVWIGRDIGDRDPATFFARDLRDPAKGWDGHVVLVVDRHWLVDLTLWQCARKHLKVPGALVIPERGRELTQGGEVIVPTEDDPMGTEVSYVRIADDGYLRANDWTRYPPTSRESREWTAKALAFGA